MGRKVLLSIILLIYLFPLVSKGEDCQWKRSSSDSTFWTMYDESNKRQIYAQFEQHRHNSVILAQSEILKAAGNNDKDGVERAMRDFINSENDAGKTFSDLEGLELKGNFLKSLKRSQAHLEGLLKTNTINWIGIEGTSDDVREHLRSVAEHSNKLKSTLYDMGVNKKLVDDYFLVKEGPIKDLFSRKPSLFRNQRIIGIDDGNLVNKTVAKTNQMPCRIALLQQGADITHLSKYLLRSILQFQSISPSEKRDILSKIPHREVKTIPGCPNSPPQDTKSIARQIIEEINNFVSMSRQRDRVMAESVNQQEGHGFILLGAAHGPGVKKFFKHASSQKILNLNSERNIKSFSGKTFLKTH